MVIGRIALLLAGMGLAISTTANSQPKERILLQQLAPMSIGLFLSDADGLVHRSTPRSAAALTIADGRSPAFQGNRSCRRTPIATDVPRVWPLMRSSIARM